MQAIILTITLTLPQTLTLALFLPVTHVCAIIYSFPRRQQDDIWEVEQAGPYTGRLREV